MQIPRAGSLLCQQSTSVAFCFPFLSCHLKHIWWPRPNLSIRAHHFFLSFLLWFLNWFVTCMRRMSVAVRAASCLECGCATASMVWSKTLANLNCLHSIICLSSTIRNIQNWIVRLFVWRMLKSTSVKTFMLPFELCAVACRSVNGVCAGFKNLLGWSIMMCWNIFNSSYTSCPLTWSESWLFWNSHLVWKEECEKNAASPPTCAKKNLHSLILAAPCDDTCRTEWFSLLFSVKSSNFRNFLLEILNNVITDVPENAVLLTRQQWLQYTWFYFSCLSPCHTVSYINNHNLQDRFEFHRRRTVSMAKWQSISAGKHITLTTKKIITNNSLDLINKSFCCHAKMINPAVPKNRTQLMTSQFFLTFEVWTLVSLPCWSSSCKPICLSPKILTLIFDDRLLISYWFDKGV